MPLTVAQSIETWIDSEHVHWNLSSDILAWAEAFETDFARAWTECPRVDYLMALAAAAHAPHGPIVKLAATEAREAMKYVPTGIMAPARAAIAAEQTDLRAVTEGRENHLASDALSLLDTLHPRRQRAFEAHFRALPAAFEALFSDIANEMLELASLERRSATEGALLHVEDLERESARVAARMDRLATCEALRPLADRVSEFHAIDATVHAVRAAAASANVATAARSALCRAELAEVVTRRAGPTSESLIAKAHATGRCRSRVFTEAALAFWQASHAHATFEGRTPKAWRSVVLRVQAGLVGLLGKGRLDGQDRNVVWAAVEAEIERRRELKLSALANRVREALPLTELSLPTGQVDQDVPSHGSANGALDEALHTLLPVLRMLGESDAVDAAEAAIAMLRGTGPMDKRALATVMRTVNVRMLEVARRRMAASTGEERASAEAAVAEMEAAVAETEASMRSHGGTVN